MGVTVTGAEGRVCWSYRTAATLRTWTIVQTDGVWTLAGTLADVDDFAVSQRPLKFVTPNGWCWPIVTELQITDGTLHACLGPKESSHAALSDRHA